MRAVVAACLLPACSAAPLLPPGLEAVQVRVVVEGDPTVRIAPSDNANARARLNAHEARVKAIPLARKELQKRLPPRALAAAIKQHLKALPKDALPFRATVVDDSAAISQTIPTLYFVVTDYGFVSAAKGEDPLLVQVRLRAQLREKKRTQWESEVQRSRGIGPAAKAGLDVTRPSAAEVLLKTNFDQAADAIEQEAATAVDTIAFRLRRADK